MNLTFPETVNQHNLEEMQKLVRNGPAQWPGAKYVRKYADNSTVPIDCNTSGQKVTVTLKFGDCQKIAAELQPGDIVDRHVRDGDYVLFNRQPSLHKMSMMCHKVKVMPFQTFRLNVACTPSYNADKRPSMSATGDCLVR
jgi:DNA-directed RNA polymerase beta' subunit